jgi:glycosyltransferase involved in cell wall biosynthesis
MFGWADSVHVQRWVKGVSQRGLTLKLISLGGQPLESAETIIFPRHGKHSYLFARQRAVRSAREFKPDLVHAHYAAGFGLWTHGVDFAPTIVSVWGADIMDFPSNWLKRRLISSILNRAWHITATSQLLRNVSLQLCPHCKDKVTVIPFGVELPAHIKPPPPAPPVKLCYIKAHRQKYGPGILLRALALVKKSLPNIKLTMAGQGEMTSELKMLTGELNVESNVSFVGHVPNEQIFDLLQEHHIMVMPSVMASESFGVAAVEAAACERPVIASNIGGVPEVVLHEQTGLLVTPRDPQELATAILQLAHDEKLRGRFGRAGRQLVIERYQWNRSLDLMCDLYERLIHEKKNKA